MEGPLVHFLVVRWLVLNPRALLLSVALQDPCVTSKAQRCGGCGQGAHLHSTFLAECAQLLKPRALLLCCSARTCPVHQSVAEVRCWGQEVPSACNIFSAAPLPVCWQGPASA